MQPVVSIASRAAFDPEHPSALAMYCSDGRFTRAVEELLQRLGHARLDVLSLPGGPALLDLTSSRVATVEVAREAASFLIRRHGIQQVVLLSHESCGYYRERFPHESAEAMLRRQKSDLVSAARWLVTNHAGLKVSMFYAETGAQAQGKVRFVAVSP